MSCLPLYHEYRWYNTQSYPLQLQCGILRLEVPDCIDLLTIFPKFHDVWITAQIFCNGIPIQHGFTSTSFANVNTELNSYVWNCVMNLHVWIRDLSNDATMVFRVLYTENNETRIYGITAFNLFDETGCLKSGIQKLVFYVPNIHEVIHHECQLDLMNPLSILNTFDPNIEMSLTNYDNLIKYIDGDMSCSLASNDLLFIMEKNIKHYQRYSSENNHPESPALYGADYDGKSNCRPESQNWLDSMSYQRLRSIHEDITCRRTKNKLSINDTNNIRMHQEIELTSMFFLVIELPQLGHPVFHEEVVNPSVSLHKPPNTHVDFVPISCVVSKEMPKDVFQLDVDSKRNDAVENKLTSSSGGTIYEFCISGSISTNTMLNSSPFNSSSLGIFADWDSYEENLAEAQYRSLARDMLRDTTDPSIKPNVEEKETLDRIVNATGTYLPFEDRDIIYRFRYFLTENKRALAKFLLSVDWSVESEVAELPFLLSQWKIKAPIDISDALRLLGKEKAFQSLVVRHYAVTTLYTASDEDLLAFLLQLVQALRYEPPVVSADYESSMDTDFLQGTSNSISGDDFNRSNIISSSFSSSLSWAGMGASGLGLSIVGVSSSKVALPIGRRESDPIIGHHGADIVSPLAQFIIDRACVSPMIANFLYWYLKVEGEGEDLESPKSMYGARNNAFKQIMNSFMIQLASSKSLAVDIINDSTNLESVTSVTGRNLQSLKEENMRTIQGAECAVQLHALNEYISKIIQCHTEARHHNGRRDAKQMYLRNLLRGCDLKALPCHADSVPLPLNPRLHIVGLNPDSAVMFASAVYPCVIEFYCIPSSAAADWSSSSAWRMSTDEDTRIDSVPVSIENYGADSGYRIVSHDGLDQDSAAVSKGMDFSPSFLDTPDRISVKLMFKSGDDLRQDQLIMQMMSLMDGLLQKVNLDLKVLTYGILAVSHDDGIMEFVTDAQAISSILKDFKSIANFLRHHNPDVTGPYEISAVALDTFVKSTAAACVMSYILGIGDRHLDNIMLKTNGQVK